MNVNTGELRTLASNSEYLKGFTPVPNNLEADAEDILQGKNSAMVDMSVDSPLVSWAMKQRKRNKKKINSKIAKASRKVNRRKH